jgi:hypothetical protein
MHPPLGTGRGPSPWRTPPGLRAEPRLGRLEMLAWLQLGALVLWSVWLALLASLFFSPELACFAADTATCAGPGPTTAWVLSRAGIRSVMLGLACLAIVVAWRHRRGTVSRAAAIGALMAPLPAALVARRIVWLPTPF